MIGIDILSDTHDRSEIKNRLEYIRREILGIPKRWLLVTGDLTDNGNASEYSQMAKWLRPWSEHRKLIVVPGNHDAGWAGNLYQRRKLKQFDRTFGTRFAGLNKPSITEIVKGGPKTVIIGLDSNRETWWPGDFARGRIGIYQRWCLSRMLKKYRDWVRIVALHHHPFTRDPFMSLSDSDQLMRIVAGECDVLCFGHRHKPERCLAAEIKYGIRCILASGASYKEDKCWRIEIFDNRIYPEPLLVKLVKLVDIVGGA